MTTTVQHKKSRYAVGEEFNFDDMVQLVLKNMEGSDPRRAKLQRAIAKGEHADVMYRVANLLERGAKGVKKDAQWAAKLYETAIEEGGHVAAMTNLACPSRKVQGV